MSVHAKEVKSGGGVKVDVHHDQPQPKPEAPKKPVAKPVDTVVKPNDHSRLAQIFTQNLGQPDPQLKLAKFDLERAKGRYVQVILKKGASEGKPEEVSRKKAKVALKSAQAGFGEMLLSPAQSGSEAGIHQPKHVDSAPKKVAKDTSKKPGFDTGSLRGHAHG